MTSYDASGQAVERHINWGGVLKGVAIVAAVAVVAVVGGLALAAISDAVTTAIMANAGLSSLAAGVQPAVASVAGNICQAAGTVVNFLSTTLPTWLAGTLNLSGALAPAAATSINNVAGIVGATTAGAVATHAMLPSLQHGHYVDVDPNIHTKMAASLAPTVSMHDITHMTHHAAEHANERHASNWSDRFSSHNTSSSGFAERAQKPSANFTEQLNADRANLDAALAK